MKLGWKIALTVLALVVAGAGIAFGVIYLRYNGEVRVTDRGVVADDPDAADANAKALNRMLLFAHKGTTLVFDEGDYYVSAGKTGGLTLLYKNGVTLRGEEGATLINTTYTPYRLPGEFQYMDSNILNLVGGKDIRIEGLSFDYQEITSVTGVITEVGNGAVIFEPYEEYRTGETPLKGGGFAVCASLFDENGVPGEELWLADNTTLIQSAKDENQFLLPAEFGKVGQTISVRFTCWGNIAPTVNVMGVKGLTMQDLRVFSTPSACIFCSGDGEDYTFERITVEAREESRALFCSNGDGVHLQGLRGSLTLRDCRFVGMGDDVLNIHVRAPIVSAVEGDTVTLSYAEGETAGDFAKVGDRVELFSTDGERLGETTVTAVKKNVFTLETMPSGVADGVLLNNLSRQPDTLVDGCFVQRGRARAILLQTDKATVTDSTFRDLRGPGVLIAPDLSQWHEMGPCREAVLDRNTFVNCCSDAESGSWGAITVTVNHNRPLTNAPKIHGSVTLTHNDISDSGPIAISLNGVSEENVTLEDNSLGDAKVLIR